MESCGGLSPGGLPGEAPGVDQTNCRGGWRQSAPTRGLARGWLTKRTRRLGLNGVMHWNQAGYVAVLAEAQGRRRNEKVRLAMLLRRIVRRILRRAARGGRDGRPGWRRLGRGRVRFYVGLCGESRWAVSDGSQERRTGPRGCGGWVQVDDGVDIILIIRRLIRTSERANGVDCTEPVLAASRVP